MYEDGLTLVTGGAGMIGFHVVDELVKRGARVRTVIHERPNPHGHEVEVVHGDLREASLCAKAMAGVRYVVHAAGVSGGLQKVALAPIQTFTDNVLLNTVVLDAAAKAGVERYAFISNSAVYPATPDPVREDMAGGGGAAAENHSGSVKLLGELQCELYAQHTPIEIAIVRGGNAYGPWDMFDSHLSHVMPALISKAVTRMQPYEVWGTGENLRDFVHARDVARGVLHMLEHYAVCKPVNVATGASVRIRDVLDKILELDGYGDAQLAWRSDKPSGYPIKRIDVTTMRSLGFEPQISLEQGLTETLAWYRANRLVAAT